MPSDRTRTKERTNRPPPTEPSDAATYCVVGSDHVGTAIAEQLDAAGHDVTLVSEAPSAAEFRVVRGVPDRIETLRDADITSASTVVVALPRDEQSLLVAQLVRTHFDVDDVRVLVRAPQRRPLVADAGHETVCATAAMSDAVVDDLPRVRNRS